MGSFFTRKGDDGYTDLLGAGRIPKFHPQPSAYGAIDEVVSVLGLAKAFSQSERSLRIAERIQRDLYTMMAEIASTPENREKFPQIDLSRIEWLEGQIEEIEREVEVPKDFILPGDSIAGAFFDLARTVVRRAERLVARLIIKDGFELRLVMQYLNRLSSLCFILTLWEDAQAGFESPTLAKG